MEDSFAARTPVPEMYQKPQALSFLGRRSLVPRPLTQVTDFYDTDIEDDEDTPSDLDSASTLSSWNDLVTPRFTNDLASYQFHLDTKSSKRTPDSQRAPTRQDVVNNDESHEVLLAFSPIPHTPNTPMPPQYQSFMALRNADAELDETLVRTWNPEQVADYMAGAGFDSSVVDKLLDHDISGSVLLDLQFEDLKELDITSFGKRRLLMTSIQKLRNSTLMSPRQSTEMSEVSRAESQRRGRFDQPLVEDVAPAESVSIVAIEQVLPKLHQCAKGEDCPKWQRQQLKIRRIEEQWATEMKGLPTPGLPTPSVVASSDVLGPGPTQAFRITSERLSTVEPRDPLENVRNFLSFQHVNSPTTIAPQEPSAQPQFSQHLNGLPKLTIPTAKMDADSAWQTPLSAFHNPTDLQAKLRAELTQDPYHYGGVASPVDVYRTGTPMSTTDIPITALPIDPFRREISNSVPPEMRYGAGNKVAAEPITRSQSTQPPNRHHRQPSFVPSMTVLREDILPADVPPVVSEVDLVDQKGWMRKRKTTRMLKHEWQDNYCSLQGTQLGISKDQISKPVESINVDEYTLHAYATASNSKLSAAFKKSIRTNPTKPAFAFSLIPEDQKKSLFDREKSHHFAVNSGTDRVEWMRKLMLAKAMKKNNGQI